MKKLLAMMLAVVMVFQLSITALAFVDTTNNIFTAKKYTHDDRFADREIVNGLDISVHQGTISDFNVIKAAGVDFMFLRAAYRGYGSSGSLNKDTMFDGYARGALAAGIDIGAYIYSQAITVKEAIAEADYILNIVKDYNITLPIVFDYEYISGGRLANANLSNRARTDICLAFCERVEKAGYTACVYANHSMFKSDLYTEEIASEYIIWLAQYHTKPELGGTFFAPDYEYWQYSSSGSVAGINTRVDCNFRYFKAPEKVNNLKLEINASKQVVLSWDKVKNSYGYEIYKLDQATNSYVKIATNKGAGICKFVDSNNNGQASIYKVKAIARNKGKFVGGEFSDEAGLKGSFELSLVATDEESTTIKWQQMPGATEYRIMRATEENGPYFYLGTVNSDAHTYIDFVDEVSTTYYYVVEAVIRNENGKEVETFYSPSLKVEKEQPTQPEQPQPEPTEPEECKHNSIKIVNKVAPTYFNAGYTGDTACELCDEVISIGAKVNKLKLAKPKFSLKYAASRKMKVTYKKVTGATGFQVRYRIKGSWTVKTFKYKKNVTVTIKNLKKGTYKVQVRALVTSNGATAYSVWAATKKVKIK